MSDATALSNDQLLAHVTAASVAERRSTAAVVRYLAEVESRRLHLALGFSSLFDFTVKRLGYSSSAALRRIKAARVTLAAPQVATKLETGELNFSTVDVLANFLNKPELESLTQQLSGRSREDAEKIVAHLRPMNRSATRDRVKPIVLKPGPAPSLPFEPEQNTIYLRTNAQPESRQCEDFGARPDEMFQLSFTMDSKEKLLLDRAQLLLFSGDRRANTLGKVVARLAQFYLARQCPKERQRRREERTRTAEVAAESIPGCSANPSITSGDSRTTPARQGQGQAGRKGIPRTLRDRILARDGHRCTFEGPDGTRCSCGTDLEIDHIVPVARGGTDNEDNLRVLCRAHNLEAAYAVFGEKLIDAKIRARKPGSG